MVRAGRLAAAIVLLFIGLGALGISYYAKSQANADYNTAQCGNQVITLNSFRDLCIVLSRTWQAKIMPSGS